MRSLRRFPSHKLRVFKEKIFLHLDDTLMELACGRVSKFYWWVAIRSRAWGLVSLIV